MMMRDEGPSKKKSTAKRYARVDCTQGRRFESFVATRHCTSHLGPLSHCDLHSSTNPRRTGGGSPGGEGFRLFAPKSTAKSTKRQELHQTENRVIEELTEDESASINDKIAQKPDTYNSYMLSMPVERSSICWVKWIEY